MAVSELANFNLDKTIYANAQGTLGCGVLVVAGGLFLIVPNLAGWVSAVGYGDWGAGILGGVLVLITLGFAWLAFSSYAEMKDPRRHAIYSKLAKLGPVDEKATDLEKQVRENGQKVGDFVFTPDYLLETGSLNLHPYTDLVWIYKKQTKHSINFIPTGTTYEVVIHLRDGQITTQSAAAAVVDQVLAALAQGCPWIAAGYSEELNKLWTKSRQEFVAEVDARRQEYLALSAQGR